MSSSIIIIDDIPLNTELLHEICIDEGLTNVRCFNDPVLAVHEIISMEKPDLIIADINMPTMKGTDVLNRLEFYFGGKLNAILVTAYTLEPDLLSYPVLKKGSMFYRELSEFLRKNFPGRNG